jgi:hypothetical protein
VFPDSNSTASPLVIGNTTVNPKEMTTDALKMVLPSRYDLNIPAMTLNTSRIYGASLSFISVVAALTISLDFKCFCFNFSQMIDCLFPISQSQCFKSS